MHYGVPIIIEYNVGYQDECIPIRYRLVLVGSLCFNHLYKVWQSLYIRLWN